MSDTEQGIRASSERRRRALVTGASGAIGHAIARRLAKDGFSLVLTGRQAPVLEQLCTEIETDYPVPAVAMVADLTDYRSVVDGIAHVGGLEDGFDVLINNAGGWSGSHFGAFLEKGANDLETELDVNLLSTVLTCRAVLPAMVERRYGRVVNVSSIAGIIALEGHSAYSAAKAGHTGLTRQLAVELGPMGVTTNCVAPGAVLTTRAEQLLADDDPAIVTMLKMTPTGELTTPEQVADIVGFLASEAAGQINGQTIAIDGGMTAA